ncbi:DUF3800 domain-containing protein [Macrococcoides goetzii]|uniref:DUF3800 domain-containing protein n=1 Tax=Macrococcus sp. PK TaxID=2801919 RepID=UPI001F0D8457|nr:DUF3800 domain-containing protein [Macrococcus sp. PK]MCH4984477.1 DUF3800 domain-containing protein [Macrococcus sp. PK]
MQITFYGDESGTITLCNDAHLKYFYIGMISTNEKDKVKRVFRKSKMHYIKHKNSNRDYTKEIKGSEMNADMKGYILEQLVEKTDITFHYIVADNHHLRKILREKPHITFNFLIGRFLKVNCVKGFEQIHLILDNRNKNVDRLKDLQYYLETELIATTDISQVKVQYVDSKQSDLVQVADVFNNLLFRYGNGERLDSSNKCVKEFGRNVETMKLISDRIQFCLLFPNEKCEFNICY